MTAAIEIDAVPGPRGLPYLGNLLDIDRDSPIEGFVRLAREYGPVYRLATPAGTRLMVSGPDLVDEICDDEHYDKKIAAGLKTIQKSVAGHGLFSSDTEDPLWHRAHHILMPAFAAQAMHGYLPRMLDIAGQLCDRWSRLNPDEDVDVAKDMTSLTFDTIALCGFDYRFNSFYRDTPHPFVAAMVRSLLAAQARARRLPIQNRLHRRAERQADEDQALMRDVVQKLIDERRASGEIERGDLLGLMLTGVDRQSGEGLPDDNIIAQCLTFLIAGHETTSGLLTFALYFLVKHPEYGARARAEVDEVLGDDAWPSHEQLHRLTYVRQVLEETLRLWPTAPLFTRAPFADTVLGGRYAIPAGTPLTVLIPMLHRSVAVWGPDAEEFDPDHVAAERLAALPPNAYKPFGTGQRACIGRQFALQEAILVLGMLLQRFEFVDHLDYELKVRTTLTVKPDGFRLRVLPRPGRSLPGSGAPPSATIRAPQVDERAARPATAPVPVEARHDTPLAVLFGSNLGTAEGLATRLAAEGTERGYAVTLGPLDDHVGRLPTAGAAVVVSSSYNGTPPDNAAVFCRWLQDPATPADVGRGLAYTVFGCGDTAWSATYQKVPTLLDTELAAHGAHRVHPRGEGDAEADFDEQYRAWHESLWTDLATALDLPATAATPATSGPRLSITVTNRQQANPVVTSYDARAATVLDNRELVVDTGADGRSVRHLEIALPAGTTYRAGDHLGVLPRNTTDQIWRVMARFGLDAGQYLTISPRSGTHTHLPIDEPTPLLGVLGACVELQDPAGRDDIETLAAYTDDPEQRRALLALAGDDDESRARYRREIGEANRSVLDLLEEYPACEIPFEVFVDLLPPLRPRYYSISSSPLVDPQVAAVTAGVLRAPARRGTGTFAGVCSGYLARVPEKGTVFAFVRSPSIPFHPPENPHTPMIMIGAGTGIAPFRGFLQERDALRAQGVPIGPSLLFFGCRGAVDDLYHAELDEYEKQGVVRVRSVHSRDPVDGRRYVQHEMRVRGDEVWELLEQDASVFVCGNATTMAPAVREALVEIHRDRAGGSGQDAADWLAGMRREGRFVEDIWGG
ncbi:bifunctional cytochrome P450/NADPH--P450 reductase [Actinomycetospora cinnamomea]|uniref:Bifunctional cytochrome P450/NADPH--P450 reductase n=1 Tax=Actinomycetospora cinnamomea TaxID=663609 RepID=A0A2U1FG79_9PSEU|nr:cytochrome P450 [Actinomycetospora cinnamomea]PVZ11157.1 cytochrome P450/NADPH-cytochrome P450 reductase [Actinomycetospora cinnamomea]